MEKKIVDCRGLSCPQPVVETKKAIDGFTGDEIDVIVDNETACTNVTNFTAGLGWTAQKFTREGNLVRISLKRGSAGSGEGVSRSETGSGVGQSDYIVYLSSDVIGRGDDELGKILMRSFIKSLPDTQRLPKLIIMLNSGVRLAAEGSVVLEDLKEYEKQGIEIRCCGTCVDFYGLKEKLRVGKLTNMFEIISALQSFNKVVQP
ncbi:MAG: sulfurtransferase-like selenium metabolism protein YedF [Syntrophaceae bacterium]